ncbi:hypothetical protein EDB80DRAFT_591396, partial [Ilyonectria destructans]
SSDSALVTYWAPVVASAKQHRRRHIYRLAKSSLYNLFHERAGNLHSQLLRTRRKELLSCDSPNSATEPGTQPKKATFDHHNPQ